MLQNIREKSQGVLAWTIVILLIATFALWGVHSYIASNRSITSVAVVNGEPITVSQLNTSYQRLRQQQQMQLGANFSLTKEAEALLKKQALSQLVLSQVMLDAAKKAGYRVTRSQVDQALLKIPAFQQDGQFSIERFHDVLSGMIYTQDQFLADMRGSMLINQAQGGYINSAFVLPNEVNEAVRLVNQKRDVSYLIIPASRFSQKAVHQIKPSEIQDYYKAHQSEYQSPEQLSISYLTLSLKAIKSTLHFDKTKLEQYYETNIQSYTEPQQWHVAAIFLKIPQDASHSDIAKIQQRAQSIWDELKNKGDFGTLAEKYSEDVVSAKNKGELNWFSAGTLDPAFEKAVANLQNSGDVSNPVKTGYGMSIIKLLGVKKARVQPFDEVKTQVESALLDRQAEQIFSEDSDKLQNLTYANPESLEVAARALNLEIQSTNLFGRNGTKSGITSHPKVVAAAFSHDVLFQGNNSDLIQIDPNSVVVLRIKEHKPSAILPLADVESTIQMKLRNSIAQKEAESQGEMVLSQLQNHKMSLAEISKKYSLSLQSEKNAGRYDTKVDAAILNQAFKMPYPSSTKGMVLPSGDFAIISLNAVHQGEFDKDKMDIQSRVFKEELESNYGHLDYQFYVRDLMKKSKIKFNQEPSTQDNMDIDSDSDSSSS